MRPPAPPRRVSKWIQKFDQNNKGEKVVHMTEGMKDVPTEEQWKQVSLKLAAKATRKQQTNVQAQNEFDNLRVYEYGFTSGGEGQCMHKVGVGNELNIN